MDKRWLELCRDGDASAIERLVCNYQKELYRLAFSIMNDHDEAEDCTQDAFLAVLHNLDSFRGDSSFKTWLYSITINICRDRFERRKHRQRLQSILNVVFSTQHAAHPEENAIQNESDERLWQRIRYLDEKHRMPLILRYFHNLPAAEIAQILGLPLGTVHSRLNTARERLRDILKDEIV
jgi:RNA polymerase sigma-70 factor, ECF subfamily